MAITKNNNNHNVTNHIFFSDDVISPNLNLNPNYSGLILMPSTMLSFRTQLDSTQPLWTNRYRHHQRSETDDFNDDDAAVGDYRHLPPPHPTLPTEPPPTPTSPYSTNISSFYPSRLRLIIADEKSLNLNLNDKPHIN